MHYLRAGIFGHMRYLRAGIGLLSFSFVGKGEGKRPGLGTLSYGKRRKGHYALAKRPGLGLAVGHYAQGKGWSWSCDGSLCPS